jgi:hypothetical protein
MVHESQYDTESAHRIEPYDAAQPADSSRPLTRPAHSLVSALYRRVGDSVRVTLTKQTLG